MFNHEGWSQVFLIGILAVMCAPPAIAFSRHFLISPIQTMVDSLEENGSEAGALAATLDPKLASSFNSLIANLSQKRERDAEIAAAKAVSRQLTHDIRSPLATLRVLGKSDFLGNSETRRLLQGVSDRIQEILADLEENPLPRVGNLEVKEAIETVVFEKKSEFTGRPEVALDFENLCQASVRIITSPGDFNRTLSNLINNAYESIPVGETGRISVSLGVDSQHVEVRVKDTGRGLSEEAQTLALRGMSSKGGTGLGLTFAQRYLEKMGGTFRMSSVEGEGTEVLIQMPGVFGFPNG